MSALRRLSYFFLPLPFAASTLADDRKSIVIGHEQCVPSRTYPQAISEKIRQVKWFFAHASVGSNMLDGLADLRRQDAEACSLEFMATDREAPASTRGGVIY